MVPSLPTLVIILTMTDIRLIRRRRRTVRFRIATIRVGDIYLETQKLTESIFCIVTQSPSLLFSSKSPSVSVVQRSTILTVSREHISTSCPISLAPRALKAEGLIVRVGIMTKK